MYRYAFRALKARAKRVFAYLVGKPQLTTVHGRPYVHYVTAIKPGLQNLEGVGSGETYLSSNRSKGFIFIRVNSLFIITGDYNTNNSTLLYHKLPLYVLFMYYLCILHLLQLALRITSTDLQLERLPSRQWRKRKLFAVGAVRIWYVDGCNIKMRRTRDKMPQTGHGGAQFRI